MRPIPTLPFEPRPYWRPIPGVDAARPANARPLAGGLTWYAEAECLTRGAPPRRVPAEAVPEFWRQAWDRPRADLAGLSLDRPRIMGIFNATPDSFSDGGVHTGQEIAAAGAMAKTCDILDVGGESTRPGAAEVPVDEEIARTAPLIQALRAEGVTTPISIDTRKSAVAKAALEAGADIVNDVSGLQFDPWMAKPICEADCPVVLMHMRGTPDTMTGETDYDDVLLDVYDEMFETVVMAQEAGIARDRIVIDPGIGFAKDAAQNIALLKRISLFHGLGLPILLGVSRKRFIGTYTGVEHAPDRLAGSLATLTFALTQGVQVLRVHDSSESIQAARMVDALIS